ncbi:MAG: transposase [Planctomycetes bacterium]|nr:transposase [Planctomycetota bacterium]
MAPFPERILSRNLAIRTVRVPHAAWESVRRRVFRDRPGHDLLNFRRHSFVQSVTDLSAIDTIIGCMRIDYNHRRPHSALDYQTPAEFAAHFTPDPLIQSGT